MPVSNKCVAAILETLPDKTIRKIGITGTETDAELSKILKKGILDLQNEKAMTITSAAKIAEVNKLMDEGVKKLTGEVDVPRLQVAMAMLSESTQIGKESKLAAGFTSLEDEAYAIRLGFESKLSKYLDQFKPGGLDEITTKLGFEKSKIGMQNVIRFIFKPNSAITDSSAKGFATAWTELVEDVRVAFNTAAGNAEAIKKLDSFAMPQTHNKARMLREGKAAWREMAQDVFDQERIMKELGIEEPEQYPIVLDAIYDSVVNDGFKVTPGNNFKLRRAVNKLHQESRVMHFLDGDAFIKYQEKFGDDNYYQTMMSYLDRMSKEIAAMRKFGPNPDYVVGQVISSVKKSIEKKVQRGQLGKAKEFKANLIQLEDVYADLMGRTMSRQNRLASSMQVMRNIEYGAKLGFAAISALTDVSFTFATARFNQIPVMKAYARQIKNLTTGGKKDKEFLLRMGVMSDFITTRANQVFRFGESTGTGLTAAAADATIKLSGLNHWTITAKNAFGMEFLAAMSKITKGQKLPPRLMQALSRYGIGPDELAIMAKSKPEVHRGVEFINPQAFDQTLRNKIVGMIHSETRYAVPEPNARIRAMIHRGTQGGTAAGEIARAIGQLKTFPATIMTSHWSRAASMTGTTRIKYAGSLIAGTFLTGMAAQYAYDAAKGNLRDPRDPNFLWEAFDRGGALGMFGDFINASDRKYGLLGFAGGPMLQTVADVFDLFTGNIEVAKLIEARYRKRLIDSKIPKAVQMAERMVPGQVWWIKKLVQEAVWENLNAMIDPNINKKQQRINRRFRKRGDYQWWKAGDTLPKF